MQGTLPLFSIWNVFTALPTLNSVITRPEYLTRTFATFTAGRAVEGAALGGEHVDDIELVAHKIIHVERKVLRMPEVKNERLAPAHESAQRAA